MCSTGGLTGRRSPAGSWYLHDPTLIWYQIDKTQLGIPCFYNDIRPATQQRRSILVGTAWAPVLCMVLCLRVVCMSFCLGDGTRAGSNMQVCRNRIMTHPHSSSEAYTPGQTMQTHHDTTTAIHHTGTGVCICPLDEIMMVVTFPVQRNNADSGSMTNLSLACQSGLTERTRLAAGSRDSGLSRQDSATPATPKDPWSLKHCSIHGHAPRHASRYARGVRQSVWLSLTNTAVTERDPTSSCRHEDHACMSCTDSYVEQPHQPVQPVQHIIL